MKMLQINRSFFALLWIVASGFFAEANVLSPRMIMLPNGLPVYFIENHRSSLVTVCLTYQVGSADDPQGKSGLAHFVEHMMFKGPPNLKENAYMTHIKSLGGTANAATSFDCTSYITTLPKEHVDVALNFESKRMQNLQINDDQVAREKKVILEEILNYTDDPFGVAFQENMAQIFLNHPYRIFVGGYSQEVETVTAQDVRAFHQRWYHPNNAFLVICGDLSAAEAFTKATFHFGAIPFCSIGERRRLSKEPYRPQTLVAQKQFLSSRVKLPYVNASKKLNISATNTQQLAELQLLCQYLTGAGTGYLWNALVEKTKTASFVQLYPMVLKDYVTAHLSFSPAQDVSLETLEKEVAQALQSCLLSINTHLTKERLSSLKRAFLSRLAYTHDDTHATALALSTHLGTGLPLEAFEDFPEAINRITPQRLYAIAKVLLQEGFPFTVKILPKANHDQKTAEEEVTADPSAAPASSIYIPHGALK